MSFCAAGIVESWYARRQIFWENYSKAANDAAQSLAVRRNKEAAVRDVFRKAVARLIPVQVGPLVQNL